ncbi:MAG: metalloregulator ArsR/SmtB family transcription factor [Pseudomonadota bacterium]
MEISTTSDSIDLELAVAQLGALAQNHRLGVFRVLIQAGHNGLAAGKIAELLDVPRSSLSFHLSNLKTAGLVCERREGRSIIYSADYAAMHSLIAYLLTNCCAAECVEPTLIEQLTTGEP